MLGLSQTTRIAGIALALGGAYLCVRAWSISPFLSALPAMVILTGVFFATLGRELVFDREAGILRVCQRTLFWNNRAVVPLFHLRAVVIMARPTSGVISLGVHSRYIAYLERRGGGDAIYLDESRRCANLLEMAEAIAEVASVRLEYDAMSYVKK